MKKIILDTLGIDSGLNTLIKGAIDASKIYPEYRIVLVGKEQEIKDSIKFFDGSVDSFDIVNADVEFKGTDSPMDIPRGRDETSLVTSLMMLRNDEDAVAMITCGSTGGFIVGSAFRVGMIDGVRQPALASPMININKRWFALVDCGANLDCDSKTLVKFAKMGSALMKSAFGNFENPRVGLLNVGKEERKGNAVLKETYPLLKEASLNFIGNIEGHDIYLDKADVVVCDGYTGNVFLKGASALSSICEHIVYSCGKDDPNILKAKETLHKMFNYNEQGAAIVLGPRKICLKAHGTATSETIVSSIRFAVDLDKGGFINHMKEELGK